MRVSSASELIDTLLRIFIRPNTRPEDHEDFRQALIGLVLWVQRKGGSLLPLAKILGLRDEKNISYVRDMGLSLIETCPDMAQAVINWSRTVIDLLKSRALPNIVEISEFKAHVIHFLHDRGLPSLADLIVDI